MKAISPALRVAFLDDYQGAVRALAPLDRLAATVHVDVFEQHHTADELADLLAEHGVVVAMRERTAFGRDLLERLPALRLLVTTGMANAAIDLAACADLGVVVSGTRSQVSPTVELTWALIHALTRHVVDEVNGVRAGGWMTTVGDDLAGRRLGVVGLGRIGARVAAIGRAYGMDVGAWSANLTADRCAEVGVEQLGFAELLERSDIVTIHLRLSDRTRGLIGVEQLARMRPGALLVNTSRGPICDESAVLAACARGHLGGVALDVFDDEPLPADHPARRTPNVIATPHLGYVTESNYRLFFGDAIDAVNAFADGAPARVLTPRTG